MATRVIVCGCRDFDNKAFCFSQLDEILSGYTDPEIVSGHADGADHFGEEYAKAHGLKLSIFPAEWSRYGRAAGPIRNRKMLEYASEETPLIIAFWNGKSRGTKNMIMQANKAGAEVHIVNIQHHE